MAYTKTVWQDGDVITAQKMNNIENGIESAADYIDENGNGIELPTVTASDNGMVLGVSEGAWNKLALAKDIEVITYTRGESNEITCDHTFQQLIDIYGSGEKIMIAKYIHKEYCISVTGNYAMVPEVLLYSGVLDDPDNGSVSAIYFSHPYASISVDPQTNRVINVHITDERIEHNYNESIQYFKKYSGNLEEKPVITVTEDSVNANKWNMNTSYSYIRSWYKNGSKIIVDFNAVLDDYPNGWSTNRWGEVVGISYENSMFNVYIMLDGSVKIFSTATEYQNPSYTNA